MSTTALKNALIHRIAEINDVSFLEAIKTILDSKTNHEILALTDEQRDDIIASKKEIEKGLYVEHDALDKEINAWLNAK